MLKSIILLFLIICTITDIKERKILNVCTFPLICIGFFYNIYKTGVHGFLFSLKSMVLIALLLFFISLFIQGFGFGDMKLLMGIAACIGLKPTLKIYIISLVLFILYEIIFEKEKSKNKILNSITYIKTILFFEKQDDYKIKVQDTKPFSAFILIAFLIVLIL